MSARTRLVLSGLAVLPMAALLLHGLAIAPLAWSERELTQITSGAGRQYLEPLGTSWMSRHQVGEPPAVVFENGVALACANLPPEAIAEYGTGGFILADQNVYFSASDNSDPRSNGRRYTLRWPAPPPFGPIVLWLAA